MTPMDALLAAHAMRSALVDLIEIAGLHLQHVESSLDPNTGDWSGSRPEDQLFGGLGPGPHPDWPDRIGSQVLDQAQTVERIGHEWRRVLQVLRGEPLDPPRGGH